MFSLRFWLAFILTGVLSLHSLTLIAAPKYINKITDKTKPTKLMIILDASGSMKGKIKRKQKIYIAREVINDFVSQAGDNQDIGLMTYGHRRKRDCRDIETLVKVGPVDENKFRRALYRIRPKGKTPSSEAVLKAAKELDYKNQKSAVILVTDGKENCFVNACKLGKKLNRYGKDFKVYIIGFNMKEKDESLVCMANETGGLYFTANNADQLKKVLNEAKTRSQYVKLKVRKKESLFKKIKLLVKSPDAVGSGLRLRVVLTEGDAPLQQGVRWWVNEAETNYLGKRKNIDYSEQAEPIFKLKPGIYQIVVVYGDVRRTIKMEVNEGAITRKTINLDAGYLRLYATDRKNGDWLEEDVRWWISKNKPNDKEKTKPVGYSASAQPTFTLSEGKYYITAKYGEVTSSDEVTVHKGKITSKTVNITAGSLAVAAVPKQGGGYIERGIQWFVTSPNKNSKGKYNEIATSSEPMPIFHLAKGRYRVVAKYGKAESETFVNVNTNKKSNALLNMHAGRIRLTAYMTDDSPPLEEVKWWIKSNEPDKTGDRKTIEYSVRSSPIFALPAGEYQVVVGYGDNKSASTITVYAGDEKNIAIMLN